MEPVRLAARAVLLTAGILLLPRVTASGDEVKRGGVRFEVPAGCVHKQVDSTGFPDVTGLAGTLSCRGGRVTIYYDLGWRAGNMCTEGTGIGGFGAVWVADLPPNQAGQHLRVCARQLGGKPEHFLVLAMQPGDGNFFMSHFEAEDVVTLLELGRSLDRARK